MSLSKIYVKLYNTSDTGTSRIINTFGLLYTSLSRITDPRKLLIERFEAQLLDDIANSQTMAAMQKEFLRLDVLRETTEIWSKPLYSRFTDLFKPAHHCRHSKTFVSYPPLAPEKAIILLTAASKAKGVLSNKQPSVYDYYDSRKIQHSKRLLQPSDKQPKAPKRQRRRRCRSCRRPSSF